MSPEERQQDAVDTDAIEKASLESFPASDPPAWTPVNGERAADPDAEAALRDRLLRALAEQENIRRRAAREREEAVLYAASGLARDLLPTLDTLRRALDSAKDAAAAPGGEAVRSLLDGVAATERALLDALKRHDIEQILPEVGDTFDPHRHEAVISLDAPGRPAGTIAQILQPGFLLHGRLLRPAMVGVASGAGEASDAGGADRPRG